jgi:hypothetical protein
MIDLPLYEIQSEEHLCELHTWDVELADALTDTEYGDFFTDLSLGNITEEEIEQDEEETKMLEFIETALKIRMEFVSNQRNRLGFYIGCVISSTARKDLARQVHHEFHLAMTMVKYIDTENTMELHEEYESL